MAGIVEARNLRFDDESIYALWISSESLARMLVWSLGGRNGMVQRQTLKRALPDLDARCKR